MTGKMRWGSKAGALRLAAAAGLAAGWLPLKAATADAAVSNPTCADLGYELELKVDPPRAGHFVSADGLLEVEIVFTGWTGGNPKVMDWSSDYGVDAVLLKAGRGGHGLYEYDPAAYADGGLTTPNANGNAISHILFCYSASTAGGGSGETDPAQTPDPSDVATEAPTEAPTGTATPTAVTTEEAAQAPTQEPTQAPTEEPTQAPTEEPTQEPTEEPTQAPTEEPTQAPTEEPTQGPTEQPTQSPTEEPTQAPTEEPTQAPIEGPTQEPGEPTATPDEPSTSPTPRNSVSPNDTPIDKPVSEGPGETPDDESNDSSTNDAPSVDSPLSPPRLASSTPNAPRPEELPTGEVTLVLAGIAPPTSVRPSPVALPDAGTGTAGRAHWPLAALATLLATVGLAGIGAGMRKPTR